MRLDTIDAVLSSRSFRAMGTTHTVTVTDEATLESAFNAARDVIDNIDSTCSRFMPDSELSRLNRKAGDGNVAVSALLGDAIDIALQAAESTGGLVDPTVGATLWDLGYSKTFTALEREIPDGGDVRKPSGWKSITWNHSKREVALTAETILDLGATGKAWAADRAAQAAARQINDGVVVSCGGDVAIAGPAPRSGWHIAVGDGKEIVDSVLLFDGGLATSAASVRRWRRGGKSVHHIIDPLTGMPVKEWWSIVN